MTCQTFWAISLTFINVTIKGIDEKKYRKVKSIAVEEDVKVSEVVNEALEKIIEEKKHHVKKIDKNDPFFRLAREAVDYGVDTDVRNADKYIYQ